MLSQAKFTSSSCELLYISVDIRQEQIGELDEHDNLIILTKVIPVFAGKQNTSIPSAEWISTSVADGHSTLLIYV